MLRRLLKQRLSVAVVLGGVILCAWAGTPMAQVRQPALSADEADQPVRTSVQNPDAVAVVMGIMDYQDSGIPQVTHALKDAEAVQRVLTQTLGYSGGFETSRGRLRA